MGEVCRLQRPTALRQHKSREVWAGRMAGERGNFSALARGAPFAAACIFGQRKKDQCPAHLASRCFRRLSGQGGS
jgi:hypothetical protein